MLLPSDPMTRPTESAGALDPRVNGQVFRLSDRVLVCRYPVSTSLPIPLGVKAPASAALLTWAFAGLGSGAAAAPHGLLVVATPDAAACDSLVLETHFRDIGIALAPAAVEDLSAEDRAILCRAVLSAVEPGTIETLATLFPLLLPAMRTMPVATDAPDLALASDRAATLSGYIVPNYLLLTAGSRLACLRVEAVRLRFGSAALAELTLAPVQGELGGPPDGALLLGNDSVVRARLRPEAEAR